MPSYNITRVTGGAQVSGGAGGSGEVVYPEYMQDLHSAVLGDGALTTDITEAVEEVLNNSPYDGVTPYDPNPDVDEVEDRVTLLRETVDEIDPYKTWTRVLDLAEDTFGSGSQGVANYENEQRPAYLRTLAQFSASMGDVGAYFSSSYVIGKALIAEQFDRLIAAYAADVNRAGVMDAAKTILHLIHSKVDYLRLSVSLQQAYAAMRESAKNGYKEKTLSYQMKDTLWNLDAYKPIGNFLAAIQGGVTTPGGNVVEPTAMDDMNLAIANEQLKALSLENEFTQNNLTWMRRVQAGI